MESTDSMMVEIRKSNRSESWKGIRFVNDSRSGFLNFLYEKRLDGGVLCYFSLRYRFTKKTTLSLIHSS